MIKKIKKYIPLILAAGFITLVVFYEPNIQNLSIDNSANISSVIESRPNNDWGTDLLDETKEEGVVYYGVLYRYSTSGTLSFYFYDIGKNQLDEPDNPRHWFWARPENTQNEEQIERLLEFVNKNAGAVFKIIGTRNPDDTGYYEDGTPIPDIAIKKIEVYKNN